MCRFKAIPVIEEQHTVDPLSCEGCGYCPRVYPEETIVMENQNVGKWFISDVKTGTQMVHARLGIGAENSGKPVAQVKNEAKRLASEAGKKFVLVDGLPGVGCPVVSSLWGASFVLLVTEPTFSALHDLKRVYELVKKFSIRTGCIINKSDLSSEVSREIEQFLGKEGIVHIASLPYNETFTEAMTEGQTIVEYDRNHLAEVLKKSWEKVKEIV